MFTGHVLTYLKDQLLSFIHKFSFVRPANEKRRKSSGFQDFSEFFFLHGQLLPPYSICSLTLILGGIKKLKKGKI